MSVEDESVAPESEGEQSKVPDKQIDVRQYLSLLYARSSAIDDERDYIRKAIRETERVLTDSSLIARAYVDSKGRTYLKVTPKSPVGFGKNTTPKKPVG